MVTGPARVPSPFSPELLDLNALEVVFPVFSIIGLGYFLARQKRIDIPTMSEIAVNVTTPCLIFFSIARREIVGAEWLTMGGAAACIVLGAGALMWIYQRARGLRLRGLYLPAMFMNAGNMALPFALLGFGTEGFDQAIIFFIAVASMHFSLGVFIAKGEGGHREIFRLPLIYAVLGGLAFSMFGVQLPKLLLTPVKMLADMAIPLMILNLGVQLRSLKVTDLRLATAGVCVRMGGGLIFALAFIIIFGVSGVSRNIILLCSIMPPAVFNIILAQKYAADPDVVASAIVLGTVVSVISTPIFLMLVA